MDDEVKREGNSVNYKYRMHDPRVGRFFAVDPLAASYPWNSPYAFSENSVIAFVELEGLEKYYAADGGFIGSVGVDNTIRVFTDTDVDKAAYADMIKKAAFPMENSPEVRDQLNSSSTTLTQANFNALDKVLRSLAENDLGIDLKNTKIRFQSTHNYAIGAYNDSEDLIKIKPNYEFSNDKTFLLAIITKENTHRTDQHLLSDGYAARDLNGSIALVKSDTWKNAPEKFRVDALKGAGKFIWEFSIKFYWL